MKKIIYSMMVIFTLSFFPFQAFAGTTEKPSSSVSKPPEPVKGTEIRSLLNGVEVSNHPDKSTLRSKKNAQVEEELEWHHHRHGREVIYISAGSVVLFLLIVFILL